MTKANESKPARLNIRISELEKKEISRAAGVLQTTVSDFVLQKALAEARAILADHSHFRLDEKKWRKICSLLDRPPRDIPALRELLHRDGVFDG